jgi:autotransporter-associated beta strand protein
MPFLSHALRPLSLAVALAALAAGARADVSVFVDSYNTNTAANQSVASNAAIHLLQGYSQLWATGSSWNNGAATVLGAPVLAANQAYVIQVTRNRTAEQELAAYYNDRRHQSFSAIAGLGDRAGAFQSAAGAFTTITSLGLANTAKYDDKSTGAGDTTSASVGKMVTLVNTLRGSNTSSNPSKSYFNSPRPWRLSDDGATVTATGLETTGYTTAVLADGTPDLSKPLTYFPDYASSVIVAPSLMAVRSTTPATDGGFVSGHTNAAYLASIALAYAAPERFSSLMLNASEMGELRIVAGQHLPLDVIGGRMLATALSAAKLYEAGNTTLKAEARAQGAALMAGTSTGRFDGLDAATLAANRANRELYTFRMTYDLPATAALDAAAVVPKGAEVLLETKLNYLSAEQRREVLRTTAIASGHAVTDDAEGWGRLNLYAAGDGYGRFDSTVTVRMLSADGGMAARDAWHNDIGGTGGLVKQGDGSLALTGQNSFSGGVSVEAGELIAASATALGVGNVSVAAGATLVDHASGNLLIGGNLTLADGATFEYVVDLPNVGGALMVSGLTQLDGKLRLNLADAGPVLGGSAFQLISTAGGALQGRFDSVELIGVDASQWNTTLSYNDRGVTFQISAVPEPQTWALLVGGLAVIGALARRRRG